MTLHLVSHRAIHLDPQDPPMGQMVMVHLHSQVEGEVETPFALSVVDLILSTLVLNPRVPLQTLVALSAMGYILRLSAPMSN